MRIPLTKYGWPEVVISPAVVAIIMIIHPLVSKKFLPIWAIILIEAALAAFLIWILCFFRDPNRQMLNDKNVLLAPADGKITDIQSVEEENFIGANALRIGIFMGIFDVHINRCPCNVKVEKIILRPGKYKIAKNPDCGKLNHSIDLWLVKTDSPKDRLIVRQISGYIARRIVCCAMEGQVLTGGEKFGMIKFGSRTELYVPLTPVAESGIYQLKCLVKIGDKVKAGLTPLVRYEIRNTKHETNLSDESQVLNI